jgi:hypothetical protein
VPGGHADRFDLRPLAAAAHQVRQEPQLERGDDPPALLGDHEPVTWVLSDRGEGTPVLVRQRVPRALALGARVVVCMEPSRASRSSASRTIRPLPR